MADLSSGMSSNIGAKELSNLSQRDQEELQSFITNQVQKSAIQETVHELTSMCFKKCITGGFRDNKLDKYEEPCVQNCVLRYMDANMTILKQLERMRGTGS